MVKETKLCADLQERNTTTTTTRNSLDEGMGWDGMGGRKGDPRVSLKKPQTKQEEEEGEEETSGQQVRRRMKLSTCDETPPSSRLLVFKSIPRRFTHTRDGRTRHSSVFFFSHGIRVPSSEKKIK